MSEPTNAEQIAQRWHEDHIEEADHSYSSCWCCCIACDHVNPYFDAAQEALMATGS